jgi:negative regulator of sigma E activity
MENIDKKNTSTFQVLDKIEKVEAPHFFSHKVLQQIAVEKEKNTTTFSWFSPALQLTTVALVLLINTVVLIYSFNSSNSSNADAITTFAQDYSLQESSNSILN